MTKLLSIDNKTTDAEAESILGAAGYGGLNIGQVLAQYPMKPNSLMANMTCFLKYPFNATAVEAGLDEPPACPDPNSVYGKSISGTYTIDQPDSLSDVSLTFDGEDLLVQWNADKLSVNVDKLTSPWSYFWTLSTNQQVRAQFYGSYDKSGAAQLRIDGRVSGVSSSSGPAKSKRSAVQFFSGSLNIASVDPKALAPTDNGDTTRDLAIGFGVGLPALAGLGSLLTRGDRGAGALQDVEDFQRRVRDRVAEYQRRLAADPDDTQAFDGLKAAERMGLVARRNAESVQDARAGLLVPVARLAAANAEARATMERASQVAARQIVGRLDLAGYLDTPQNRRDLETVSKNILDEAIGQAIADGHLSEADVLSYDPAKPGFGAKTEAGAAGWQKVSETARAGMIDFFGSTVRAQIRSHAELRNLLTAGLLTQADYDGTVASGLQTLAEGPAGELPKQYQSLAVVEIGKKLIKTRAATAKQAIEDNAALTSTKAAQQKNALAAKAETAFRNFRDYSADSSNPTKNEQYLEQLRDAWHEARDANRDYSNKVEDAVKKTAEAREVLKENAEGATNLDRTGREAAKEKKAIERRL